MISRRLSKLRICVNCLIKHTPKWRKRVLFLAVADTLGALRIKGLPLALVTNKPTPFVAPILDALDIAKYFTVVIGAAMTLQNKKPHPEPLLLVAENSLWLQPSCCLSAIRAMIFGQPKRQAAALSDLTYGYNYGEAISLSEPDRYLSTNLINFARSRFTAQ